MRKHIYLLLLAGLACITTACGRGVKPEEALAYLQQAHAGLAFELADGAQPKSGVAYGTTILGTSITCQVQREAGRLQDNLEVKVVETLVDQVDEILVQDMGLEYDQLGVSSPQLDAVTFSGVLPQAGKAAFKITLVGDGRMRLAVPAMAVKIPVFYEADRAALLPAGTLVKPISPSENRQYPDTYVAVQTERYGEVCVPQGALLATVECRDVEVLENPYELQNSSAIRLQYWPGDAGAQPGLIDRELSPNQVLQVIARWQDWLMVLSRPFPWYPGSASCGWVRADQLVSFDPDKSPDAWVKAGAELFDEASVNPSKPDIVLTEPLLMYFVHEENGNVLLIHPQDATYWTKAENVIGKNPFRRP